MSKKPKFKPGEAIQYSPTLGDRNDYYFKGYIVAPNELESEDGNRLYRCIVYSQHGEVALGTYGRVPEKKIKLDLARKNVNPLLVMKDYHRNYGEGDPIKMNVGEANTPVWKHGTCTGIFINAADTRDVWKRIEVGFQEKLAAEPETIRVPLGRVKYDWNP